MSYSGNMGHPADFEVRYRFYTPEEGGRLSGTPFQGYRCDWAYDGESFEDGLYMIWPEFIAEDGLPHPKNSPVSPSGVAAMWIVVPERREQIHRGRIREGVRGYFMEGPRRVAEAVVTRVLGLPTNPTKSR